MSKNETSDFPPDYGVLFRPRSIAIVGASSDPSRPANAIYLQALLHSGYAGKIYPISRSDDEIAGLKAYPSILDVPGPVDYVIVAVSASAATGLMRQCVEKGVKLVNFFTAGFSETESQGGRDLEQTLVTIAAEGGVRILGPNCMGVYDPGYGLSYSQAFPATAGDVGCLCQSGGNATLLIGGAAVRGVAFSRVISYGNAIDLNEADLLSHFADDPDTRLITAYIEGFRDGARFFDLLRRTTLTKPVIAVKGGRTEAGTRAVSSHTGSLAGSDVIWETLARQTGMIIAESLEEMIDLMVTFKFFSPPAGPNAALLALGGGVSVLATDACEKVGLKVPRFSDEVIDRLKQVILSAGTSVNNPVDAIFTRRATKRMLEILSATDEIDFLVINLDPRVASPPPELASFEKQMRFVIDAGKDCDKPMAVVLNSDPRPQWPKVRRKLEEMCVEAGLPVYSSVPCAARAIAAFRHYHRYREAALNC